MKYQDVLKRFVSEQAQLLQEKQMKQQLQDQMLAAKAQGLQSFIPGQRQSHQEEYSETEHNPFEEGQEYRKGGGIHIDPSKKGTFKAQATRMGMSIQEAASHILNNRERYSPGMVKKANFAKNFAKEDGGMIMYPDGGVTKTHKSKDGNITNLVQKADGSKVIQVKTKNGEYYEKTIPMDFWGELETAKNNYNDEVAYEKALNYSGIAAYPAAIASSGIDVYDGNYGDAAIGLIPFIGKQARTSQLLRRKALTELFNMGVPYKTAKHVRPAIDYTTKALGLGSAGYDIVKEQEGGTVENPYLYMQGGMFTGDYDYKDGGEMIRRADGSYSQRGLWDNIRDNAGSGKKPTKEMLEQEKKIRK